MTLLDDFEARYKLLGIQVVNAMLEHAPFPLLVRTGISELILAVWFRISLWTRALSDRITTVFKPRPHVSPLAAYT
jgi:hypothetical protein